MSHTFFQASWVALGGALGALARYGLGVWIAPLTQGYAFPVSTLAINWLGSFLLGLTLYFVEQGTWPEVVRLGLGIGFLGAFTTFSTFSFETESLLREAPAKGVAYITLSVLGGLLLVYAGKAVGRLF